MVLDHDRDLECVGHREVVGPDGVVARLREGRWRKHHRTGSERLGLLRQCHGTIRRGVADARADGQATGRVLDRQLDHPASLLVGEPADLAHHAEDRHPVDAGPGDEVDKRADPVLVEAGVVPERRRDDVPDAAELIDAGHRRVTPAGAAGWVITATAASAPDTPRSTTGSPARARSAWTTREACPT